MCPWQTGFAKFAYGYMPSCFAPNKRRSKVRRIPLSELTEDGNQGKARVVRERGVYADFATETGTRQNRKSVMW